MAQIGNQTNRLGLNQKVVFVAPRYGEQVVGGAERLMRGLAEELHNRGYAVEVLTTCIKDIREMTNFYEPGVLEVNGVTVRRFLADHSDIGQIHRTSAKAISGEKISYAEQMAYIRQNCNSQALYQYLSDNEADIACAIFGPYLFGLTYWGVQAIPDKAVLLPCFHDEPIAYFTIYRELLEQVRGVIFNAEAEREFAISKLGMANRSTVVVGLGFDQPTTPINIEAFRSKHKLPAELLLYSGRIEAGKNVLTLLEYFERYQKERNNAWVLALTGGDSSVQEQAKVIQLGFLENEELPSAYAAAKLLVQPSLNESFSIVIMEAWQQSTPVLVHGECAVTSEHVQKSGGGWTFSSYEDFRDVLDTLLTNAQEGTKRGELGKQYVATEYSWDATIVRLEEGLQEFTRPVGLYEQLSRRGVRRALEFSRERFEERFEQVIKRAERDLDQGITRNQIQALHDGAKVSMPDYQVSSATPVVGKLVAQVRRNLTSHLREPYIDPIINKQEEYNKLILETLLPAIERSQHNQRRLERQIRLLERRVEQLQNQLNANEDQTNKEQEQ